MTVPETRLTVSVDIKLVIALQAKLMTLQKRKITIAEVIRIAIEN